MVVAEAICRKPAIRPRARGAEMIFTAGSLTGFLRRVWDHRYSHCSGMGSATQGNAGPVNAGRRIIHRAGKCSSRGMATVDHAGHAQDDGGATGALLKKAARAIGSAVGAAAARTGIAHAQTTHEPRIVNGKFQKSHKHRLPRKLKKLQKKTRQDEE